VRFGFAVTTRLVGFGGFLTGAFRTWGALRVRAGGVGAGGGGGCTKD
jgi:hypothetical protein